MKISLNNRDVVFEAETLSVSELITLKNLSFRMKIVKINGQLVKRSEYESAKIHDGDNVQVLYLMSGG